MLKGIDISMHNNTIDFAAVKNNDINVVIIKATEGVNYIDPFLNQHYQGAKAQNFNIGFYHFMSEKTSPTQQAIDFWNCIKDKQFNIVPCLDIETNNMGRSTLEISNRCIEFLEKFKRLSGMNCMIYTGGFFGRDNLDKRVKKYPGWIAHYEVDTPMATGFDVIGHQFTEHGHIEGITGNVDVNNFTEKIFIQNKDEKKVKYLVVYNNLADKRAAEYLADKLNCPTMWGARSFDYSCIENVIGVGGTKEQYTSYLTKLISGNSRYDTMQAVLNYINNK